jgi:MFS family permease
MPSIDLLDFVERFLGGLTNFFYSLCGSIWLLIRHPAPAARYLARRVRSPDVRQVGPLTLHFIGFVIFFAALQMTYSGRGAYADYDGADMARRLTPGWGGELSWELGRVLMGALAATAVIDAIARLLANVGWPMVSWSLQTARRRSKTRRRRAVQAGFALFIPLAAALVPSLLFYYLLSDNVSDEWLGWVFPVICLLTIILFVVLAGWTGYAHLRLVPFKKTPANQRPGLNQLRNGYMIWIFAVLAIFAGMMVMNFTERAFRYRVFSNKESVRMRVVACSIGVDEKLTVTGLVANIGTRLAALDLHGTVSLGGYGVALMLYPVPTDGPMLVLKPGEGKAFTFIRDPNDDQRPLLKESYEGKACWLQWQALGPDANLSYWGGIHDHRAPKKK